MQTIKPLPEYFHGHVSVEEKENGLRPWRLPIKDIALFPPDQALPGPGGKCSGVRLRLKTDANKIGLRVEPLDLIRHFDLVIENELISSQRLSENEEQVTFENIPEGEQVVEIWLPSNSEVTLRSIQLNKEASCSKADDPRKRWITYGSSISHCGGAHSPARTWPATAARKRNLNLTNLGYGGNCHFEPMVAMMIREMPADFISLKLGINVQGGCSLSTRTFKPAVIGLIKIILEKHAQTPIAVISPIICPNREETKNKVDLSLQDMRNEIEDAVRRLENSGVTNLTYFDGRKLFGQELVADYLPDGLHPNGDGYEAMGLNFVDHVLDNMKY